jgi:hypothetical protein
LAQAYGLEKIALMEGILFLMCYFGFQVLTYLFHFILIIFVTTIHFKLGHETRIIEDWIFASGQSLSIVAKISAFLLCFVVLYLNMHKRIGWGHQKFSKIEGKLLFLILASFIISLLVTIEWVGQFDRGFFIGELTQGVIYQWAISVVDIVIFFQLLHLFPSIVARKNYFSLVRNCLLVFIASCLFSMGMLILSSHYFPLGWDKFFHFFLVQFVAFSLLVQQFHQPSKGLFSAILFTLGWSVFFEFFGLDPIMGKIYAPIAPLQVPTSAHYLGIFIIFLLSNLTFSYRHHLFKQ